MTKTTSSHFSYLLPASVLQGAMLLVVLIFLPFLSLCQSDSITRTNTWDTIKHYLTEHKPQFMGGLHNRNSFISDQPIKIFGIRAGLDFGERVSFSIGYYRNSKIIERVSYIHYQSKPTDTIKYETGLWYFSVFAQYIFYNKKRFSLGIPVMIGIGRGKQKLSVSGLAFTENKIKIIPVESGFYAHYNITEWLGINAGLGIRFSLINTSSFNGSFYSLGINLYPESLINRLNSKKP